MSHVHKITTAAGRTRYRARWIGPDGKEKCRTFDLKRQAEEHLGEVAVDMRTGRYADPRAGRVPLRTYAQQWADAQAWEPSTRAQQSSHLRRHILPTFGDRPIGSIRGTEVQGWVTTLGKTYAPMHARNIVFTLCGVFAAALRDRVIPFDPCEGLAVPQKRRSPVTVPTPAQVSALVRAAPQRYRAAVLLAAGEGTRQSEMTGLALDRVTFPLGTPIFGARRGRDPVVDLDRQLACLTGRPPYLKPPKSRAGVRTLPLATAVGVALAEHVRAYPPVPVTLPWGRPDGKPITVKLIFTTDAGEPIDRWAWSRVWRATCTAAGVTGVDYHDLRHYAVSAMIRAGATIKEVQHFAGHASSATTLDVYGHLWPDHADRTRSALEAALDFTKIDEVTDERRTV